MICVGRRSNRSARRFVLWPSPRTCRVRGCALEGPSVGECRHYRRQNAAALECGLGGGSSGSAFAEGRCGSRDQRLIRQHSSAARKARRARTQTSVPLLSFCLYHIAAAHILDAAVVQGLISKGLSLTEAKRTAVEWYTEVVLLLEPVTPTTGASVSGAEDDSPTTPAPASASTAQQSTVSLQSKSTPDSPPSS
jgi:hypothetical protein